MKGLGDSRPRHLSDSLDPPHEPLFAGPDRNPYLLSPTEAFAREARFPGQNALPGDGLFPLNNQLPSILGPQESRPGLQAALNCCTTRAALLALFQPC